VNERPDEATEKPRPAGNEPSGLDSRGKGGAEPADRGHAVRDGGRTLPQPGQRVNSVCTASRCPNTIQTSQTARDHTPGRNRSPAVGPGGNARELTSSWDTAFEAGLIPACRAMSVNVDGQSEPTFGPEEGPPLEGIPSEAGAPAPDLRPGASGETNPDDLVVEGHPHGYSDPIHRGVRGTPPAECSRPGQSTGMRSEAGRPFRRLSSPPQLTDTPAPGSFSSGHCHLL